MFGTVFDFLLVVLGFGLIIFVHEMGHFLAARWAGIRVLAFAIGFGPALASYRKGLGWRKGSSEREYLARLSGEASATPTAEGVKFTHHALSPTEYRLNFLPFGGYVKMLGQDDMDATARSAESDSYQSCRPWKRLVVISAGVVMNIITAAILFVIVFMAGREVSPPIIGAVLRNSPAAVAAPVAPLTNVEKGLHPGDRVLRVGGKEPRSFDDMMLAIAMSHHDEPLEFVVDRAGKELTFNATPQRDNAGGLLAIGIQPPVSLELTKGRTTDDGLLVTRLLEAQGLTGLRAGDRVTAAGTPVAFAHELDAAFTREAGKPVTVTITHADGSTAQLPLQPRVELDEDLVPTGPSSAVAARHLLGLTGVLSVIDAAPGGDGPRAADQGLKSGDIFAKLGDAEYPSIIDGIQQIKSHAGKTIDVVALRRDADGAWTEVSLPNVKVSADGHLGFTRGDTSDQSALVAEPIARVRRPFGPDVSTAAATSGLTAGAMIVEVDSMPTTTLTDVRDKLRLATATAHADGKGATVHLTIQRPVSGVPSSAAPRETLEWQLSQDDVSTLHALAWTNPLTETGLLEPAQIELKAKGPVEAVRMGLAETNRVMMMTYLTFARLAQGSVKVEHLKGPVGIAHLGTMVADKGPIWLLFFLALISVNLAVINFLPLPIVDGGQFLFIIYEWVRGKPVPVGFQNAVTMAGLVMIGVMFLFVTYNDIRGLFGL